MSGIMSMVLGARTAIAAAVDEFFNRVTLLLPGDGTNGAQNNTFLDSSSNNFTITRNGNTTQGTFSPFSQTGWSNFFDGTDDYLAVADNVVLRPGTSNFTLEAWIWRNASGAAHTIYAKGGGSTGIVFQVTSTNVLRFIHTTTNIDSTGTIAANTWTHVAVVREGTGTNQTKLYINGSQDGQGTVSTDFTQTEEVRIGTNRGATEDFNGYISNLRFVKGTALYTGAFTPSTSPLTTTSQGATATEVELLTCQSNRFVDNSNNGFTITLTNTPSVQAFSPFNPTAAYSAATNGGSGYFDGTGDYLTAPSNSVWNLNTTPWTLEFWVYPTASGTQWWGQRASTSNFAPLKVGLSGTTLYLYGSSNNSAWNIGLTGGSGTVRLNAWNHIVVQHDGTNFTAYVNGTREINTANAAPYSSTAAQAIGATTTSGDEAFSGYMGSVRLIKGQVLYTGTSITVPDAPLTTTGYGSTSQSITGTVGLLLNFTNAGIIDSTGKSVIQTVGTAQISTAQSKWGGSSILFDGLATPEDKLVIPISAMQLIGTSDFTFECWVRPQNVSTLQTLITYGSGAFRIFINSTNVWFLNSASTIINSNGNFTANNWFHVAVVRKGSTGNNTACWVNGTRIATPVANTTDFNSGTEIQIGGEGTGNLLQGYLQDVRLTEFARYDPASSTITVPTAAFPLQ